MQQKENTLASLVRNSYKKLKVSGLKALTNKKRDINTLKFLFKFLNKKDKILDLACGYGRLAIPLAKKGFNIEGIDISPNLINNARKEAKRQKLKIKFKIGDMKKLHYSNETFNKIFCMWSSFNHLLTEKDQLKTLNEIYRILKSKGLAIIDVPAGDDKERIGKINQYGRVVPEIINKIRFNLYIFDEKILRKLIKKSKFKKYKLKFSKFGKRKRLLIFLRK